MRTFVLDTLGASTTWSLAALLVTAIIISYWRAVIAVRSRSSAAAGGPQQGVTLRRQAINTAEIPKLKEATAPVAASSSDPSLPEFDGDKYNGANRNLWPGFRAQVEDFVTANALALSELSAFILLRAAISGPVLEYACAWIRPTSDKKFPSSAAALAAIKENLDDLERIWGLSVAALAHDSYLALEDCHQGSRSFPEFISEFQLLAAHAGVSPSARLNFLRLRTHQPLVAAVTTSFAGAPDPTYDQFCARALALDPLFRPLPRPV